MIRFYLVLSLFFSAENLFAQAAGDSVKPAGIDSAVTVPTQAVPPTDSTVNLLLTDTIPIEPALDSAWKTRISPYLGKSFLELVYKGHPFFAFDSRPFVANSDIKQFEGKEALFYALIALFLLFAF